VSNQNRVSPNGSFNPAFRGLVSDYSACNRYRYQRKNRAQTQNDPDRRGLATKEASESHPDRET
jgi:hypothetical protein